MGIECMEQEREIAVIAVIEGLCVKTYRLQRRKELLLSCVCNMLQIYLYEYSEDFDLIERPRQVYPSAVTWFRCDMASRQAAVAWPSG